MSRPGSSGQALAQWLSTPLSSEMEKSLRRLQAAEDVYGVAVMPDAHLAREVCVGTVTATNARILPHAVGGDIGCGMATVRFDAVVPSLSRNDAAAILGRLYDGVPILKHRGEPPPMPKRLLERHLSSPALEKRKAREGTWQLGTVGRGNHFAELQADGDGRLWALVHSGSRGMGPAIRDHHLAVADVDRETGAGWLDADGDLGRAYLHDADWARAYARENRRLLLEQVVKSVGAVLRAKVVPETHIESDHNHVQRERHDGRELWVHRKGAQAAANGVLGIVPGSMGTATFHVEGRGCPASFDSSSHGAGRAMSRSEARQRITPKRFSADTEGVWFDRRLADKLREEAPAAYKDIHAVMRAQRELTKIVRTLRPLLVFKGA